MHVSLDSVCIDHHQAVIEVQMITTSPTPAPIVLVQRSITSAPLPSTLLCECLVLVQLVVVDVLYDAVRQEVPEHSISIPYLSSKNECTHLILMPLRTKRRTLVDEISL